MKIALEITCSIGNTDKTELDFPMVITMPVPTGLSISGMKLLHYHGTDTRGEEVNYKQGTDDNGNDTITFTADKFSTYIFAGDQAGSGTGGGSRSGSGSGGSRNITTGHWVLDNIGWWYKNTDGSVVNDKGEKIQ